jgi:predicted nucleotidyltransferase
MAEPNAILQLIKKEVLSVVPDAKVYLFGSRARGNFDEESDWDILIITPQKPDSALKNKIHHRFSNLWIEMGSYINTVIVSEEGWLNSPQYYVLYEATRNETVPL